MESRKDTRYSINEKFRKLSGISGIDCELDLSLPVRCRVRDISLKGVGFELNRFTAAMVGEAKPGSKIISRLYIDGDVIMAGSIMTWNAVVEEDGRLIFRGGFMFDVISTEDRLRLYSLIGSIREHAG